MIGRLDEFLARPVSMRSLGVLRILVGLIAVLHLWPVLSDGLGGETYQDHFYHPYFGWYPELPEAGYTAVVALGVVAALVMAMGLWSSLATRVTFAVVGYNLFLSTTQFHNNRAYLFIVLGLMSMSACGREFSVDAWLRDRRRTAVPARAPAWPLWLLRFECSAVYAASGFSKLIDHDWFSGTVTWGRLIEKEAQVRASLLPGPVSDLVLERSFHTFAAKIIIATELFLATGLWWRRTRPFAVVAAVGFHVMIQFTADVEIFSYLALAMLFVWADPALPWLRLPRLRRVAVSRGLT